MKIARFLLFAALGAVLTIQAAHARTAPAPKARDACAAAATTSKSAKGLPSGLLHAIAVVESGRWDKQLGKSHAWPWTVTANGGGKFYPTKTAAIRAVRALRAKGITNIDIGCMQINLRYHGDAFKSLQDGFNPARNVAVAAAFLKRLQKRKRSWTRAVKFYHSSDPARQKRYAQKVQKARQTLRNPTHRNPAYIAAHANTSRPHAAARATQGHSTTRGYSAKRLNVKRAARRNFQRSGWKPRRIHRKIPVYAFKRKQLPKPTSFAIPTIVRSP